MCRIVEFKKEHLEVMDLRPHEHELIELGGDLSYLENGVNCTGIVDGRVLCCGGVIPMMKGNAEIWLIPSVHVSKSTITFVKELKNWLFTVRESLDLDRMQTICIDDELHNRWMKFLGFEKEGQLKKYCNGKDYVMYGRTEWG